MRFSLATVLVLIAAVLVAAVGSAYVTFWWFGGGSAETATADPATSPDLPPVKGVPVLVPDLTVSLGSSSNRSAYVRTDITLEVVDTQSATHLEEQMHRVRDRIIDVFFRFTAQQIEAPGGTAKVKEEIKNAIDPLLERGEVLDVLFSELVVAY